MDNSATVNIDAFIISETVSVYEAMAAINENGQGIAFVCDCLRLLAAVTDGDIRRFILRQGDLSTPVKDIAAYQPISLNVKSPDDPYEIMHKRNINALPIIDSQGKIISIVFQKREKISVKRDLNIPVVIMAGGKGTRLYPYTQVLPKPLIPIGEKTIIEHIINRFYEFGCREFIVIVNYKRDLIKAYFSETDDRPYKITFVEEDKFLGTGGGLGLLKDKLGETFILTNCDTLIDADIMDIYHQHMAGSYTLTMVCAVKKIIVPYGIVEVDEKGNAKQLHEKPSYELMTNVGVYVIQPEFISSIPQETEIHITELIQQCIDSNGKVGVYPIYGNAWMDMGQMDELDAMRKKLEVRGMI